MRKTPIKYFFLITLFVTNALFMFDKKIYASEIETLNATIRLPVCGNAIIETGEDCESGNLQFRTCSNLGYEGGTLTCDISCSFDTTSCTVPAIDPTVVTENDVGSLLASGYLSVPLTASIISTPSVTATAPLNLVLAATGGTSLMALPQNIEITAESGENFDPTLLQAAQLSAGSLSGFAPNTRVEGAVFFGITSTILSYSQPINISIFVGNALEGQTLHVLSSRTGLSNWTIASIETPATCTVSSGRCSFRASKALFFAATRVVVPSEPSSGSSRSSRSSHGSHTSSRASSISPSTPLTTSLTKTLAERMLPVFLRIFDLNNSDKIDTEEMFPAIKRWVEAWRRVSKWDAKLVSKTDQTVCDLNGDTRCDLPDLSILLFYFER